MRSAPPVDRPISGRRENLRFRRHCWGHPEVGISISRPVVSSIPAASVLTSLWRVLEGAPGENGARKLTNCADRRGPAFESRPISGRCENLRFPAATPAAAISGSNRGVPLGIWAPDPEISRSPTENFVSCNWAPSRFKLHIPKFRDPQLSST